MMGIGFGRIWPSFNSPPGEDPWPSENNFIKKKITDATRFGEGALTVGDLRDLDAEGELTYVTVFMAWSKGWRESWYGTRYFVGWGWLWGDGTINWDSGEPSNPDAKGSFNYSVSWFAFAAGAHLRLGSPKFSVVGSYQLFLEPIDGLNQYLSVGILWPW